MVSKDDISNPLHLNLWEEWMEELGLSPDQDMVELELHVSRTSKKSRAEAGGNKSCTILHHTISYYLRETDLPIDDCATEHIEYSIGQGVIEGDLSITDPSDQETTYRGYWRIQE